MLPLATAKVLDDAVAWSLAHVKELVIAGIGLVLALALGVQTWRVGIYKNDAKTAENKLAQYTAQGKVVEKAGEKAVEHIVYKDRIIEKRVIQVKTKLEKVYAEDPKAGDWGDTDIPDTIIDSL